MVESKVTRSPTRRSVTAGPVSATSPAASCPITSGGIRRPVLPSKPCTSLPQMPQARTLTRTSSGPREGSGIDVNSRRMYSVNRSAFIPSIMVAELPRRRACSVLGRSPVHVVYHDRRHGVLLLFQLEPELLVEGLEDGQIAGRGRSLCNPFRLRTRISTAAGKSRKPALSGPDQGEIVGPFEPGQIHHRVDDVGRRHGGQAFRQLRHGGVLAGVRSPLHFNAELAVRPDRA